tara:strand:+ start:32 stop:289 length:258 start_codon:yes stop_codon:yes gene_type:complete
MIELGFPSFQSIIAIVLVFYGIKFLSKWWLRRKVANAVRQQKQSMSEDEATFKRQETGKVHIKQERNSSNNKSSGGEYVDYEEVD